MTLANFTTGNKLFGRVVEISIVDENGSGKKFTNLRMSFSVTKSERKKPNDVKAQIWNVNNDSWGLFQKKNNIIEIRAGYGSSVDVIFVGNVDKVVRKFDGNDVVCEIDARDGGKNFSAVSFETVSQKTDTQFAIEKLSKDMGFGSLYLSPELEHKSLPFGFSTSGAVKDVLTEMCESINAKWSVQNGRLVITKKDGGVLNYNFVLNKDTGLVGFPETDDKGKISVKCLLNGKINPSDTIKVESRIMEGFYFIYELEHSGDNWESDFYTSLKLRPKKG